MNAPMTDVAPPPSAPVTHPVPLPDVNPRDLATSLAVAKALGELAKVRDKDLRASAGDVFEPSERIVVRSPADRTVVLGTVTMTDPDPVAKVTDRAAFDAWMLDQHDDECVNVDRLIGSTAQVIAALREHCPADVVDQLVTTDRVAPDWAVNQVEKLSANHGEVVGIRGETGPQAPPGVEVTVGKSAPRVSLRDDAVAHLDGLVPGRLTALAAAAGIVVDAAAA